MRKREIQISERDLIRLRSLIGELQKTLLQGFENPLYVDQRQGVFRSHFDWHSSVHGHWMLLCSGRIAQSPELVQKGLSRLTESNFAVERQRLLEEPEFELPYGQSWLLLLFDELARHRVFSQNLQMFRQETLQRVIQWLESNEFPDKNGNPYRSWLMTYFLYKKSNPREFSEAAKRIEQKFQDVTRVEENQDPRYFFSAKSLFAILRGQGNRAEESEQSQIAKIVTLANCHELGRFVSQSWRIPFCEQEDVLLRTIEFTEAYMKEPRLWRDDFHLISHWIPQFLWMGLWLSLGGAEEKEDFCLTLPMV